MQRCMCSQKVMKLSDKLTLTLTLIPTLNTVLTTSFPHFFLEQEKKLTTSKMLMQFLKIRPESAQLKSAVFLIDLHEEF